MLDYAQLETLVSIDDEGSFEGAARALRISSFAVAQRIRQLEKAVGVVLVERGPTRTSDAGKILCAHTREVMDIEEEVLVAYDIDGAAADGEAPVYRIALSEESLSGWFGDVLKHHHQSGDACRIDVTLANPDRTIDLMQSGEVVAAVSTSKDPINGFKAYSLSDDHFVAVASPAFVDQHFADGVTIEALSTAPCLRYCHNDGLAAQWIETQFGERPILPLYKLPSIKGGLGACLSGHAWTMLVKEEADPHLSDGSLVELISDTQLSRSLYWHISGAIIDDMANITNAIRDVAK